MPKSSLVLCSALTLLFPLQAASLLFKTSHRLHQMESLSLKCFCISSKFSFPLCSIPGQTIFHWWKWAGSASSFSPELFQAPAPIPCSSGRCSRWCGWHSLAEVLETGTRDMGSTNRIKQTQSIRNDATSCLCGAERHQHPVLTQHENPHSGE